MEGLAIAVGVGLSHRPLPAVSVLFMLPCHPAGGLKGPWRKCEEYSFLSQVLFWRETWHLQSDAPSGIATWISCDLDELALAKLAFRDGQIGHTSLAKPRPQAVPSVALGKMVQIFLVSTASLELVF